MRIEEMMTTGPPIGTIEMPFETINEGWSIYKTKDGAIIKLKLVMLKLFLNNVDESGTPQFGAASNLVLTVTVPPEMKGPPYNLPITPKEIDESIVAADIPFETVKEDWNQYRVEGALVSVKMIATVISKSSKFDGNGDPIYSVQNQPIVKGSATPEVKEKFLRIKREKLSKTNGSAAK